MLLKILQREKYNNKILLKHYVHKFYIMDKMETLLKRHKLPKFTQENGYPREPCIY